MPSRSEKKDSTGVSPWSFNHSYHLAYAAVHENAHHWFAFLEGPEVSTGRVFLSSALGSSLPSLPPNKFFRKDFALCPDDSRLPDWISREEGVFADGILLIDELFAYLMETEFSLNILKNYSQAKPYLDVKKELIDSAVSNTLNNIGKLITLLKSDLFELTALGQELLDKLERDYLRLKQEFEAIPQP